MKQLPIFLLLLVHAVAAGKPISQIETNRELSENTWRELWKLSIKTSADAVVIMSFKVEPDGKLSIEGLPERCAIETIRYVPGDTVSEFVSYTGVSAGVRTSDDDPFHRVIRIVGFGHSFDVPGLENDGGWDVSTTGEATKVFRFQDAANNPTKRMFVTLSLKRIPIHQARAAVGMRGMKLPELGDEGWSLTLPPLPEEIEQDESTVPSKAAPSVPSDVR